MRALKRQTVWSWGISEYGGIWENQQHLHQQ